MSTENDPKEPNKEPNKEPENNPKTLEDYPAELQSHIREIRAENKQRREENEKLKAELEAFQKRQEELVKALGGENDKEAKPEELIEGLQQQVAGLKAHLEAKQEEEALEGVAKELGVPEDTFGYFKYLLAEASEQLEENEELSDESLNRIVEEAKGKATKATTSPGDSTNGTKTPGKPSDKTYEDFLGMNQGERVMLYREHPESYNTYMTKARAEGKLVA